MSFFHLRDTVRHIGVQVGYDVDTANFYFWLLPPSVQGVVATWEPTGWHCHTPDGTFQLPSGHIVVGSNERKYVHWLYCLTSTVVTYFHPDDWRKVFSRWGDASVPRRRAGRSSLQTTS